MNTARFTAWLRTVAEHQREYLTQIDEAIRNTSARLSDLQRAREKEAASLAETERMISDLEKGTIDD